MIALEKTLGKTGLARLDSFRRERGIRTRAKALRTILEEYIEPEEEIALLQERIRLGLAEHAAGLTIPLQTILERQT